MIFEQQAFENGKCKETLSLNNPNLSRDKCSKRTVINPFPRSVIDQGALTQRWRRDRKSIPHLDKPDHTIFFPSILPKDQMLSLQRPMSPPLSLLSDI